MCTSTFRLDKKKAKDLLHDLELTNLDIINCFDAKNPIWVSKLNVAMYMIINKEYDVALRECDLVLGQNPKNTIARYMKDNIYLLSISGATFYAF